MRVLNKPGPGARYLDFLRRRWFLNEMPEGVAGGGGVFSAVLLTANLFNLKQNTC
jgi:hypothetical protein